MSYKKLVESKVRLAFELVKDLAQEVTFTKQTSSDFNFGTGDSEGSVAVVQIKVVVTDNKKKAEGRNTVQKTFMAKTAEVGDMKLYESVTFGGLVWKIGEITYNDGYLTIGNLYREV